MFQTAANFNIGCHTASDHQLIAASLIAVYLRVIYFPIIYFMGKDVHGMSGSIYQAIGNGGLQASGKIGTAVIAFICYFLPFLRQRCFKAGKRKMAIICPFSGS